MTTANNPENQNNNAAQGSGQISLNGIEFNMTESRLALIWHAWEEAKRLAANAPDGQEKAYWQGRAQGLNFALGFLADNGIWGE